MTTAGLSDLIDQLPFSLLEQIPAGKPPPGVESNLVNPYSFGPAAITIGAVFFSLATLFVSVRVYTKLRLVKKAAYSDLTCMLGYLISVVHLAGLILACGKGAGGRHTWDTPVSLALSRPNTIGNYITIVTITPALAFVKVTFLLQYYEIFWPFRWVRISIYIGGVICVAFYSAITVTMFALNTPRNGQSWEANQVAVHTFAAAKLSVPTGTVGAATDIFLLVLPIRATMKLQLPRKKKIGLIIIFMTGTLASVASLVGLYYRVRNSNPNADAEWGVANVWTWAMIEVFAGVACACMPSFSRFLTDHQPFFASLHSHITLRRLVGSRKGTNHFRLRNGSTGPTGPTSSHVTSVPPDRSQYELTQLGRIDHSASNGHVDRPQIYVSQEVSVFPSQADK